MIQTLRNRVEFLSVLRNRDYRNYYLGLLASVSAHQGMIAAQGWLVYDMTGLPAALGFVAAAQALPAIVLNLFAGALADRVDPRRMIMAGEGSAALLMAILAALVVTDLVAVWHVVVIAFLIGIAISFDQPARRSIWPVLIARDQMMFAASLNQIVWNGTRIVAPPVATGIIAVVGVTMGDARLGAAISFSVIAAGFAAMVFFMTLIRFPNIERAKGATVLHDIVDGLVFSYRNRIFLMLLLMGFALGYFGLSYMWLLPAIASEVMGDDSGAVLGFLMAASGVGGLLGGVLVASFGGYQNRTWLLIGGGIAFGVAVVLFGLTSPLGFVWLTAAFAALSGALYALFQVAGGTMVNLLVPHEYRGRIMGLRGIVWSLAPLGALQSGLIATWFGTPLAITVGGLLVIASVILVYLLSSEVRSLRRLAEQAETDYRKKDQGRAATA